jgi:hypothetical protein
MYQGLRAHSPRFSGANWWSIVEFIPHGRADYRKLAGMPLTRYPAHDGADSRTVNWTPQEHSNLAIPYPIRHEPQTLNTEVNRPTKSRPVSPNRGIFSPRRTWIRLTASETFRC